jgi:hypothetical protein
MSEECADYAAVRAGQVCVVDVRVAAGYDPGSAAGIFRR